MQKYAVFLRAVNVGGTGKLPMIELKKMCENLGFANVKTYIASGNVLFESHLNHENIKKQIENKLLEYFGKPIGVFVYNIEELEQLLLSNPFKNCAPNRVICSLIDEIPENINDGLKNQIDEQIIKTPYAIFTHYGEGMAQSKLKAPWMVLSTGRNINTITKMVELLNEM